MDLKPSIFTAQVMHRRLLPKENQFHYGVFYLALPLSQLYKTQIKQSIHINKKRFVSFFEKDHGALDGDSLEHWIRDILTDYALNDITHEVVLIAMPRILNYVFNPVSFWLCFDDKKQLRAVLCEVKNTFGETHSYLCAHEDKHVISADDWLATKKVFHVSPFLKREGSYKFRFDTKGRKLAIWIDYYNDQDNKQLITTLTGQLNPLTKAELRRVFWKHPLVTMKAIMLIHWQALKLLTKGIRYISKPIQLKEKLTTTQLNK